MKKKWKRSKKRIMSALILSVLCSVLLVPSFQVEARTNLGSVSNSHNYTFPVVYGNYSESTNHYLNWNYSFAMSSTMGVYPQPNKYYICVLSGGPSFTGEWLYVRQEDTKEFIFSENYVIYNGEKFYGGMYSNSFVFSGSSQSVLEYGVDVNLLITPYTAGDGYIYANECQLSMKWTPTITIHELEYDEVAEAKQLADMIDLLTMISSSNTNITNSMAYLLEKVHAIMGDVDSVQSKTEAIYNLLVELVGENEADKVIMDNFNANSTSQSSQLGQLNQENKVDKIDINNASTTVDSNIDLNAVGSSGVVLSTLTGHNKILTMLLGVTAVSLIAYVFFGKR